MSFVHRFLRVLAAGTCLAALSFPFDASARSRTRIYDPLLDGPSESPSSPLFSLPDSPIDFFSPRPGGLRPDASPEVPERFYEQKLVPGDSSDGRAFPQRYYVYSGHASGPGAPVVFYIGGESELLPRSFMGRFAEQVAQRLHAHLVALEHRYYGKSQPFTLLTTENLRYLSTPNALADLARFQGFAMNQLGLTGKWISVGGSYPGSLSAYYRLEHPELIAGALASSAPVQAKNAFEEYDAHVTRVLGPRCSEILRGVVGAVEAASADPKAFEELKARFDASDVGDPGDFFYVLADVAADAVQYGYPERLCGRLLGAWDPVLGYAEYVRDFLASRGTTAADFSPAVALKLGADESGGMRQWYYQSCREYGYWQDAHRDPERSTRSRRIDSEYDRGLCKRFFGLNGLADEGAINARYYEPLLDPRRASRIFFTNGSDDPWSELSITEARGNAVNPETPSFMIQGKAHCSDLKAPSDADPESLQAARRAFLELAVRWVE